MKIDDRTRMLIAVGATISANCQPCLQVATAMARETGADPQEIANAIEVGQMVRKGAASKMDKFITDQNNATPAAATEKNGGCGCNS
jgi:AhpD family alkylhydroperoxidase